MNTYTGFDARNRFFAAVCAALCTFASLVVVAAPVSTAIQATQVAAVSVPLA
jgi:hypothetical protein